MRLSMVGLYSVSFNLAAPEYHKRGTADGAGSTRQTARAGPGGPATYIRKDWYKQKIRPDPGRDSGRHPI